MNTAYSLHWEIILLQSSKTNQKKGVDIMAGMIRTTDKEFIVSDGTLTFTFPIEDMSQFREIGLSDLGKTRSGSERWAEIPRTNVAAYFSKPDSSGWVEIKFSFGSTADLEITVSVWRDNLTEICYSIPPKK
ncbi:MAG TPA: hypothetical protein VJG85_00460 [Patescibacteria group bacterium]|nr:hypothetical protein [Patescibacteria group bacterium]